MQHIPLQLGYVRNRHLLAFIKPFQRPQQITKRVAQLAVLIRYALEDLIADAMIFGIIHAERPEPQNVRAIGFHQLERIDGIAERFGHFHALGIHREAVGEHRFVGRTAAGAAGFKQARLEPSAMLIGAFQIHIRQRAGISDGADKLGPMAAFQREHMGAARIEPDIKNVGDHLIIIGVAAGPEIIACARLLPRIDALAGDRGDDARIDCCIVEIFAGLAINEQRDRHTPSALAREHPIGPPLDHAANAVAPFFGDEARGGNRGDCYIP